MKKISRFIYAAQALVLTSPILLTTASHADAYFPSATAAVTPAVSAASLVTEMGHEIAEHAGKISAEAESAFNHQNTAVQLPGLALPANISPRDAVAALQAADVALKAQAAQQIDAMISSRMTEAEELQPVFEVEKHAKSYEKTVREDGGVFQETFESFKHLNQSVVHMNQTIAPVVANASYAGVQGQVGKIDVTMGDLRMFYKLARTFNNAPLGEAVVLADRLHRETGSLANRAGDPLVARALSEVDSAAKSFRNEGGHLGGVDFEVRIDDSFDIERVTVIQINIAMLAEMQKHAKAMRAKINDVLALVPAGTPVAHELEAVHARVKQIEAKWQNALLLIINSGT